MNRLCKMLLKAHRKYLRDCYEKGLYTVCSSADFLEQFYNMDSYVDMYKFFSDCKKTDKKISIPINTGREIEELFRNKEHAIGIYGATFDENEIKSSKISKMINEGININYKNFTVPDLTDHVFFPEDSIEGIDYLSSDWKNSRIDFILTFPKELLDENIEDVYCDIFGVDNSGVFIKPEYIDSYVVAKQGIMNRIKVNDIKKTLIKK